jgi:hypothetical protein
MAERDVYGRSTFELDDCDLSHFVKFALITGLTKKATKLTRRSMTRDRKTIATARVLPLFAIPGENYPLVAELRAQNADNDNVDTRLPAAWDHTTVIAKLWAANRTLRLHGEPCSFTLNLSQTEIEKALRSRKGFSGYFRESITRCLNRELGYKPKLWIAVDITDAGRLHLHGGMAIRQRNEVHLAYDALSEAGGVWESSTHNDKQAHVAFQYNPDGWSRYAIRARSKVQSALPGQRIYSIANGLIADARQVYESWRSRLAAEMSGCLGAGDVRSRAPNSVP